MSKTSGKMPALKGASSQSCLCPKRSLPPLRLTKLGFGNLGFSDVAAEMGEPATTTKRLSLVY